MPRFRSFALLLEFRPRDLVSPKSLLAPPSPNA
jgi:hypothetical protein